MSVRHLGFTIPLYVTQLQGQRMRQPSMGKCSVCLTTRHKVYLLWNDQPECSDCVELDIADIAEANAKGLEEYPPPAEYPIEVIWEHMAYAGRLDNFDYDFWNKALQ